ncbi:MAG: alanyl-tRNA editing protein [Gammaproteobacteria bacterium]|nr:alanyl-tRNA editing protein [Gammaproteobacteria bacterium]
MTQRIFEEDSYQRSCDAVVQAADADGIVLDRTVFYALGGGQPGDTGCLILADGTQVAIVDTRKGGDDSIIHIPEDGVALPVVGTSLRAEIDWEPRYKHMRMHTCLHLLCSLIDAPVTGGNLNTEKGRLDFDLPESTLDKESLTIALNELISADRATTLEWITDDELAAQPELIKTMSVQPPTGAGRVRLLNIAGVDLQPCGGTHVLRTGEIGRVRVAKIEKKSRLNRRVAVVFDST